MASMDENPYNSPNEPTAAEGFLSRPSVVRLCKFCTMFVIFVVGLLVVGILALAFVVVMNQGIRLIP